MIVDGLLTRREFLAAGGINAGGGKINVPGAGVVGEVEKRAAEGPVELGWRAGRKETKGSAQAAGLV